MIIDAMVCMTICVAQPLPEDFRKASYTATLAGIEMGIRHQEVIYQHKRLRGLIGLEALRAMRDFEQAKGACEAIRDTFGFTDAWLCTGEK